jgi:5'-nucleotidase
MVPGIEAYSVEGTPSDSVIMALNKLVGKVDMVVSGINDGSNLGEDVLISGTVGAALQGYLRGLSALAVSVASANNPYVNDTARLVALLARRIHSNHLPTNIFLNVNVPSLPLDKIAGVKITRLAGQSHIDAVDEGHDGRKEYYWLVRRKADNHAGKNTDQGAIEDGYISITPLAVSLPSKPAPSMLKTLCTGLLTELRDVQKNY